MGDKQIPAVAAKPIPQNVAVEVKRQEGGNFSDLDTGENYEQPGRTEYKRFRALRVGLGYTGRGMLDLAEYAHMTPGTNPQQPDIFTARMFRDQFTRLHLSATYHPATDDGIVEVSGKVCTFGANTMQHCGDFTILFDSNHAVPSINELSEKLYVH